MKSVTKRILSEDQICAMIRKAFDDQRKPKVIVELTDGYFNNSYLVERADGEKSVLKVAPNPEVKVLTYEHQLMAVEVEVLSAYHKIGIPVPEVLYYDQSLDLIDSEFFFMSYLDGQPLNKIGSNMSEDQYMTLSQQLGDYLNKTFVLEGTSFGVPGQQDKLYGDWSTCYMAMMRELLDDAEAIGLKLVIHRDKVMALIEDHQWALKAIDKPILIHKDIWQGNIFVDEKTYHLKGIIDCERGIYGDPLMEAVCGFLEDNSTFMKAYYGKSDLDKGEATRVKLYKFYLFLLMVVEAPYREYEDDQHGQWVDEMFMASIKALEN